MADIILALDQGTTGSTAMLLDSELNVLAKENREFPQIFPKPGWVEHDGEDIWHSIAQCTKAALNAAGVDPSQIGAIGITNQRETSLLWDRTTSDPVHHAIVWQCRRTAAICKDLRDAGHGDRVWRKTGLVLDPYFSGTKVKWVLDNVDGVRDRADRGELAFGTIDTFLIWRLTGGRTHVTDVSNASRTMMMDLATTEWDDELLALLGVPRSVLPTIVGNAEVVGHTHGLGVLARWHPDIRHRRRPTVCSIRPDVPGARRS